MESTWEESCLKAITDDVSHMESLGLESNLDTASMDSLFYYSRGIERQKIDTPVLVLIHGYPQTSFMWRHIISHIPKDIPLFIPDIPGYGRSMPLPGPHDKRSTGQKILQVLSFILNSGIKQNLIIAGHDRGARICHRLAVDAGDDSRFRILGTILMDIVPTLHQWRAFSDPPGSVGSFHWPFLANVKLATSMINAQGGDVFTEKLLSRWTGASETGALKLRENNAFEVYAKSFKYKSVVEASCDDYRAGAEEDIKLQADDQKAEKKIKIDVLVLYSADYLGRRYDIKEVWKEWMGDGQLEVKGFGDGVGHFIAEETPVKTAAAITDFYKSFHVLPNN
ncbi:putative Fluoroacetate dehalogenase [Halenospora varia]|nr:putative Fluoroacetate dehalogenase [Halenospora varia]